MSDYEEEGEVDVEQPICDDKYRDVFNIFDSDGSGKISASEIGEAMRKLHLYPDEDVLEHLLERFDINNDGELNYEEFYQLVTEIMGDSQEGVYTKEQIKEAFSCFDEDGDGTISYSEFRYMMYTMCKDSIFSDSDLTSIIRRTDKNGDGRVNYEELANMLEEPEEEELLEEEKEGEGIETDVDVTESENLEGETE